MPAGLERFFFLSSLECTNVMKRLYRLRDRGCGCV